MSGNPWISCPNDQKTVDIFLRNNGFADSFSEEGFEMTSISFPLPLFQKAPTHVRTGFLSNKNGTGWVKII
jgi:hypothetical protein